MIEGFSDPKQTFLSRYYSAIQAQKSNHLKYHEISFEYCKGGFFQKVRWIFFRSPNLKKKYSKKLSWAWNLNFPPITVYCNWRENLNFKLRIVFWNNFFWRFGDLKNESNFLKRSHLYCKSGNVLNFLTIFDKTGLSVQFMNDRAGKIALHVE